MSSSPKKILTKYSVKQIILHVHSWHRTILNTMSHGKTDICKLLLLENLAKRVPLSKKSWNHLSTNENLGKKQTAFFFSQVAFGLTHSDVFLNVKYFLILKMKFSLVFVKHLILCISSWCLNYTEWYFQVHNTNVHGKTSC